MRWVAAGNAGALPGDVGGTHGGDDGIARLGGNDGKRKRQQILVADGGVKAGAGVQVHQFFGFRHFSIL